MGNSLINSDVSDILERHIESRRWMKDNYYGIWTDVFRAIKMRTSPIYKNDASGKPTKKEDKTKTNICMPGINIAWRRGVARLTAQPYQLRYTGSAPPDVLERLSALAIQQYDRSDEVKSDRLTVMQAKAFGVSYSKVRRDVVSRTMQFKRALVKDGQYMYRDRASVRKWQGVPEDEIKQEMQGLANNGVQNPNQLSDQEVGDFLQKSGYESDVPDMTDQGMSQFIAQNGNVVTVPVDVTKYEGPVVKSIFIGDLDLEPGCKSLNDSDYVIESYTESDVWLKQQQDNVRYLLDENTMDASKIDPQLMERGPDGKIYVKAFDPKACEDLLKLEPEKDRKINDLRQEFLAVSGRQGQDQYIFPKRLRMRKQFDLLEQHAQDEEGRNWITWVSPQYRDRVIGKMPYEDDLYGKTYYTEMVLFEDMLDAQGDSTPRMMRYLHALDNRTTAQNYDMVSQTMRPMILVGQGMELGDDIVTRGEYRELHIPNLNNVKIEQGLSIPAGAFEREAIIQRRMAQLEPNMNTVDTGSNSNPMAGKLATTAMLNAKAADVLTAYELDGRDLYIKELATKKLWINQQMAGTIDPWQIDQKYWNEDLQKRLDAQEGPPPQWAISDRYGKSVAVRLDPMEIQEDLGVEPIAGSYLSVDDDIRTAAAERLSQVALAAPDIIDRKKVIAFQISTIRGVPGQPNDFLLPDPTGPVPPPFKGTMSVNMPLDKMPSDVVNQVLPLFGLQPSSELEHRDTIDAVSKLNEAGKAADELTAPEATSAHAAEQEKAKLTAKANGKPNGKPKPAMTQ